jgi:hypothetical protein
VDIIAHDSGPLKDIMALRRVVFVMKGGIVYKNVAHRAKKFESSHFQYESRSSGNRNVAISSFAFSWAAAIAIFFYATGNARSALSGALVDPCSDCGQA